MGESHFARNCILEKVKYPYSNQRKEKGKFNPTKTISFCEVENTNKEEIYVVNNEIISNKATKRSENSKWKNRLKKKIRIPQEKITEKQDLIIKNPTIIKNSLPSNNLKRKRGPSKIDSKVKKLGLEINNRSITVVVVATRAKAKILCRINDVRIMIKAIVVPVPTTLHVIDSLDDTLLLGTYWFQKTKARIHFKLYLQYANKSTEILISNSGTEGINPHEEEDFYKENPALYLTNIEEVPTKKDKEDKDKEKSIKELIKEIVNNEELTFQQQSKTKEFLLTEKNLFALSIENIP
ncbi:hypothetical protein C2G38_2155250 [Gigaspora rosea]|uniref:Uncharacterized protein n=1 Tax=Gigaspora rosea TaxID=44941 RepID=A0A397W468_9GLOM|nr:hypothetical protein C2G38_2155250 [Gigaspora rosea]